MKFQNETNPDLERNPLGLDFCRFSKNKCSVLLYSRLLLLGSLVWEVHNSAVVVFWLDDGEKTP